MSRSIIAALVLISITLQPIQPAHAQHQNRVSIGVIGSLGEPIGWWGDRWDMFQGGEFNLRYEFTPGTGLLLLVGQGKSNFASMSPQSVFDESTHGAMQEEFRDAVTITTGKQTGNFTQLPLGFGFYSERMLGKFRGYGSVAMIVYNWKFNRSQQLEYLLYDEDLNLNFYREAIWNDGQDGARVGGQLAIGAVYKVATSLFIDFSCAYHMMNISQEYGALAYYGYPARQIPGEEQNELIPEAEGRADIIQLRIGIRYGT